MKDFLNEEFHSTEMYKLINALARRGFNFEVSEIYDTPMVIFKDKAGNRIGDAVCHSGSYGHATGLLEVMGIGVGNEYEAVEGWMTADEVLDALCKFTEEDDVVRVVRCEKCILHNNCITEESMKVSRINDGYCSVGKKR